MNIHEYQAKAVLREFGVPVPRGIPAFSVEEAEKAAKRPWRSGLGGEGADPRRRPRQGGRRESGQVGRRREAGSGAAARLDPGDASDRAARQGGAPALHRGRLGDRPRVLSVDAGRPRDLARRLRGLDRRRHGHRRGRAQARRRRSSPSRSIRRPASCRTTRAKSRMRSELEPDSAKQVETVARRSSIKAFVDKDMSLLEINPLVVTKDRRADLPRRQGRLRRQRAVPASRRSWRCAT